MLYLATNYPATEHGVWFWVAFLTVLAVATTSMLGLFLIAVARDGQRVGPVAPDESVEEVAALPGHETPVAIGHDSAA